MNEQSTTNQELIEKISILEQRIAELEELESQRTRSEADLRESERNFRSLAEQSLIGVSIVQDGVFKYVNAKYAGMHGYAIDELLDGFPAQNLVHPDYRQLMAEREERCLAGEVVAGPVVIKKVRKNGEVIDVESYGMLGSFQGKPARFGFTLDITERKKAEEALQDSEEKYRSLASTTDSLMLVDRNGKYVFANKNYLGRFGSTEDLIFGREYDEFHSEEASRIFADAVKYVVETGKPYQDEWLSERSGGYWLRTFSPVRKTDGSIATVTVASKDITDRKLAEEALKKSEYFFKESQRAASIGSYEVNFVDGFWKSSEILDQIFGIDQNYERSIQGWLDIVHPDDREMMDLYLREEVIANRKPFNKEYRIRRKSDGNMRWVHGLGKINSDSEGNVIFMIGTIQDITERKQAEEQIKLLNEQLKHQVAELDAANKELDSFTYSASHDLRGPLRRIDSFSRILINNYTEKLDETGREYLARVRDACLNMDRLISDLFNLSHASRQNLETTAVDLSNIAFSIAESLRENNPERKVEFLIERGLRAVADPHLIKIALDNLIGNAWKFTLKTENARIEFGALEQDGRNVYYVRDNGSGFDPKSMDKMFQPFQRLHKDSEFAGTGIGLAIVERIIRRHGGRVWAEGEVNKGATFHFTLPAG